MNELEIKIWETNPISFATFRQRLMAFCYENNVAPDDLMIAPYTEEVYGETVEMGIKISYERKNEE